jgi:hypothetical protein
MSDRDVREGDTDAPQFRAYARLSVASDWYLRDLELEMFGEIEHIKNEAGVEIKLNGEAE